MSRRAKGLLLTLLLPGVLSGCAGAPSMPGWSGFSVYAEAVFRHQNEVSSRWMMLNDADQLSDNEELSQAEDAMDEACELLNQYAERESEGESMSWRFQSRVRESIQACDASVARVERLLNIYAPPRDANGELK